MSADAMPDTFRLSDPDARIFHANTNGCIRVPKELRFESLTILCRGYSPQEIDFDQINSQKQIAVILKRTPNKPSGGDVQ